MLVANLLLFVSTLFICLFLSLIAKYYRLKSGSGPRSVYFFAFTIIFSLGQLLGISFFSPYLGKSIASLCTIIGGTGLIACSAALYRSMMSVKKP